MLLSQLSNFIHQRHLTPQVWVVSANTLQFAQISIELVFCPQSVSYNGQLLHLPHISQQALLHYLLEAVFVYNKVLSERIPSQNVGL